jgi:hypothetical protein
MIAGRLSAPFCRAHCSPCSRSRQSSRTPRSIRQHPNRHSSPSRCPTGSTSLTVTGAVNECWPARDLVTTTRGGLATGRRFLLWNDRDAGGDIHVLDVESGRRRALTNDTDGSNEYAVWSPDGELIQERRAGFRSSVAAGRRADPVHDGTNRTGRGLPDECRRDPAKARYACPAPVRLLRRLAPVTAAAAGIAPAALMARAGHSDFVTTQLYIDLAGETFREEPDRLEERVFEWVRAQVRAQVARFDNTRENESPALRGSRPTGATGLEPATPGFGDRCSAKLSYAPVRFAEIVLGPLASSISRRSN